MKRGQKTLICVVAGLSLVGPSRAVSDPSLNPYLGIVDRNVFALKPPPPPPDPEANKPPPPPITLTGITTILGNKRALMKTPATAPRPGEPAKEQSYILTIGQREGDIEVIDIDDKAGSVKVNYAGNVTTLTFEKNGPKIAATPAPAAMPGIPAGMIPPPTAIPAPGISSPPSVPSFGTPTPGVARPLRLPTTGAAVSPGVSYGGVVPAATVAAGGMTLPAFGAASTITQPTATPQNVPSREEQMIMMEVEREVKKNNPAGPPPPPPTPLTPAADAAAVTPSGAGSTPTTTPTLPIPGRPPGFGAPPPPTMPQ